jgi:hypothetical protein
MGADIHVVIQTMNSMGEWTTVYSDIDIGRDYALFSALANVRGSGGSDPKGLPIDLIYEKVDDYSIYTGGKYLGDHSHSYQTLAELKKIRKKMDPYTTGSITQLIRFMKAIKRFNRIDNEAVRIVYGFDS